MGKEASGSSSFAGGPGNASVRQSKKSSSSLAFSDEYQARKLYRKLQAQGDRPSTSVIIAALKECRSCKDLQTGKKIHMDLVKNKENVGDRFTASALVDMYAKCGSLVDAHRIFRAMEVRDVVSWNCLIQGYAQSGDCKQALDLFKWMQDEGFEPNRVTFLAALKACGSCAAKGNSLVKIQSLNSGRDLHHQARSLGFEQDLFVANSLIDMYSKCGSLGDARRVFESMKQRSVVSWTSIIMGYAEGGDGESALDLYSRMQESSSEEPNRVTVLAALKACVSLADSSGKEETSKVNCLERGREIHAQAVKTGDHLDSYVGSALVNMYSKLGSLDEAREVFERLKERSVVTWTAIIMGYAESGQGREALKLYSRMQAEGDCVPNRVTLLAALKACGTSAEVEDGGHGKGGEMLKQGKAIHSEAARAGLEFSESVGNSLIDMYSACRSMVDAYRVFESGGPGIDDDVVSWNCIILGFARNGDGNLSLELYRRMQEEGIQPQRATLLAALKACVTVAETSSNQQSVLARGKAIRAQAAEIGNVLEVQLANALIDMYAKCGSLSEAGRIFEAMKQRSVVSWNSIVLGHAQSGQPQVALEFYKRMKVAGFRPDASTFVAVLKACGNLAAVEAAREIQSEIRDNGMQSQVVVGNSLVDCFGKCGSMIDAEAAFDAIPNRNLVSWSSLIAGYCCQGDSDRVLELFRKLQDDQQMQKTDATTMLCIFTSVLSVCRHAGLVDEGKVLFDKMRGSEFGVGIQHYACVVDLLGRANELEEALELVRSMEAIRPRLDPDVVIWMSLLDWSCAWKNTRVGRFAFERMIKLQPNNASAFVLMANLYASVGMNEEASKLRSKTSKREICAEHS